MGVRDEISGTNLPLNSLRHRFVHRSLLAKKSSQLDFRIVCAALIYALDADRFKALTRVVNQSLF
jgi:hypothetical protein